MTMVAKKRRRRGHRVIATMNDCSKKKLLLVASFISGCHIHIRWFKRTSWLSASPFSKIYRHYQQNVNASRMTYSLSQIFNIKHSIQLASKVIHESNLNCFHEITFARYDRGFERNQPHARAMKKVSA